MDKCKPYTQAELDQQAIWADEFDQWWESEGQYHRAGGDNYCRTFAWWAWLSREQSRQAEVDELSSQNQILKEVAESDTKTIERLESVINLNDSELKDKDKRIEAALNHLNDVRNKGTDQSCYLAIKALRGNNANS